MRVRDLAGQQVKMLGLIAYAHDQKAIDIHAEEFNEFLDLADLATEEQLPREELAELARLIQQVVQLPLYTTEQAATWLGMSVPGVQYALSQKLLNASKPGHDLVFTHDELSRYAAERRYQF